MVRASQRVHGGEQPMDWQMDEKAVALAFDPAKPDIPTIIATGRGALAEQIVEIAFQHGVKVREDADLVEILEALELGAEIPLVAFAAVAEILSHVYRAELASFENAAASAP